MSPMTKMPRATVPATAMSALHRLPPGRWVLGFSGGPDSVGLAALLRPRTPLLCYVDHGLRGAAERRAERRTVRAAARRLGLDLVRTRVRPEAASEGAARRARYVALHAVVRKHGAAGLLLAHTADDRAETVAFNLMRGTGLRGLATPRPRTVIDGVVRLRPALCIRRAALHAEAACYPVVGDLSNRCTVHARARWRALGLPALAERLAGDPIETLCRLAEAADEIRTALERRAARIATNASRDTLLGEQPAAFPYLIEALRDDGPPLTARAYAALRDFLRAGRTDRSHETPGGESWRIERDGAIRVGRRA